MRCRRADVLRYRRLSVFALSTTSQACPSPTLLHGLAPRPYAACLTGPSIADERVRRKQKVRIEKPATAHATSRARAFGLGTSRIFNNFYASSVLPGTRSDKIRHDEWNVQNKRNGTGLQVNKNRLG